MAIKYHQAPDIRKVAEEIVEKLGWDHVLLERVAFLRSTGSKARQTIARCHSLGKAMQVGMGLKKGFYLVEVISEKFDKLPSEEQLKVIIHELMHIPKSFGGGFIHHNKVDSTSVDKVYNHYCRMRNYRTK